MREISSGVDVEHGPMAGAELPDQPRIRHTTPLLFKRGEAPEDYQAVLLNLSHGGLAFMSTATPEPGESLWVHFRLELGHEPLTLLAAVRWVRPLESEYECLVGVELVELSLDEQEAIDTFIRARVSGKAGAWPLPKLPEDRAPLPQVAAPVPAVDQEPEISTEDLSGEFQDAKVDVAPTEDPMYPHPDDTIPSPVYFDLDEASPKGSTFDEVDLEADYRAAGLRRSQSGVVAYVGYGLAGAALGLVALMGINKIIEPQAPAATIVEPIAAVEQAEDETFSWLDDKPEDLVKPAAESETELGAKALPSSSPEAEPEAKAKAAPKPAARTFGKGFEPAIAKGENVEVTLVTKGPATGHESFWLDNPRRLVVDVPNQQSALEQDEYRIQHKLASKLRVGNHKDKVRFVLETSQLVDKDVEVSRDGDRLVINLRKR